MPRAELGQIEFFYSDKFIFFTFNLPDFHTMSEAKYFFPFVCADK